MPRGDSLKNVDRVAAGRKGGLARAEAIRKRRQEAEDQLGEHVDAAIFALAQALSDPSQQVRAAAQILDRTLGRATERTELVGADGGPILVEEKVDTRPILQVLADVGLLSRTATNGAGDPAAD